MPVAKQIEPQNKIPSSCLDPLFAMRLGSVGRRMASLLAALGFLALAYDDVLGRVGTNNCSPGAPSGSPGQP